MAERVSFGEFLTGRRKYMNLTQTEMAERIGVSKSAVAKWEINGGIPDRDNLMKISEITSVKVDELYKIIKHSVLPQSDFEINITPDIITILEAYGYKVIRPTERNADCEGHSLKK